MSEDRDEDVSETADTIPVPPLTEQERDLVVAIETMTGRTVQIGRSGITFEYQIRDGSIRSRTIESHGKRVERVVAIRNALQEARIGHDPPDPNEPKKEG